MTFGDPELLRASEAGWEMMLPYLSVGWLAAMETKPSFRTGSRENGEHCGAVDWMITSRDLARITGVVKYADAVERAMFNGYPAPKHPDGMALGYMHSPNQLVATEWSQPHDTTTEHLKIGGHRGSTTPQPTSRCAAIRMARVASPFTSKPWFNVRQEVLSLPTTDLAKQPRSFPKPGS